MADRLIAQITPTVDIHKIIDDVMATKDRSVCILITGENMSVSVTPLGADKPRWTYTTPHEKNESVALVCSECGVPSSRQTPYCPWCGEKLACIE